MALPPADNGATALVTGASSGLGEAFARQLAERGYRIALVARSEDKLRELADDVALDGVRAEVLAVDLSDRDTRAQLLGRVEALGLTPSILINNAGFSTTGPVADADPEAEAAMVEVDVTAVVDLTTRFLPGMVIRGAGAVLNVASTAAFQPLPGQAAYAASKAFVLSYTQAVGEEVKRSGVTITALCPGPVETAFLKNAGFTDSEAKKAMPSVMWLDAAEVAKAAVDGLDKGRRVVIPGIANQVSARFSWVTPRSLLLPALRRGHPALHRK